MKKITIWLTMLLIPFAAHGQTAVLPVYACVNPGVKAVTSGISSTNYLEGVIPSCLVKVYLTGTTNIATTSPQSPFTANTNGSIPPIYAATGQAYDVVLSGGIAPNTYQSPVTLTGMTASGTLTAVTGTFPVDATTTGSAVNVSCPGCATTASVLINPPSTLDDTGDFPNSPGLTTLSDGNLLALDVTGDTNGQPNTFTSYDSGATWPVTASPWTSFLANTESGAYPLGRTAEYASLTTLQNSTIFASIPLGDNNYGPFERVQPYFSIGTITNPVLTYPIAGASQAVATDASGNAWITEPTLNSVVELDHSTGAVLRTCTGINNITYGQIAVDQSTGNVWVAQYGSNTVTEISSTCAVVQTDTVVGLWPYYIALDSSHNAWVTNQADGGQGATVTGVTIGGGAVTAATISGGTGYPNSNMVVFQPTNGVGEGGYCTATATGGTFNAGVSCASFTATSGLTAAPVGYIETIGTVSKVTPAAVVTTYPLKDTSSPPNIGTSPQGIAVDSADNVWVTNIGAGTGGVNPSVMELTAGTVVNTVYVGGGPAAVTYDGTNIWVVGAIGVTEINPTTAAIIGGFGTGTLKNASGIAVYSGNVYLSHAYTSSQVSIWTPAGVSLGTYQTSRNPFGIAISTAGMAWTPSFNSSNVTAVNVALPVDTITWTDPTVITMPVGQVACADGSPAVQLSPTKLILPIFCVSPAAVYPWEWPTSSGYVTLNYVGSAWVPSALTITASAANDPVPSQSNGYDESAMWLFPSGKLVNFIRHEGWPSADPTGTYARQVSTDGGTTWSAPVDVLNVGFRVGRPSVLGLGGTSVLLCGRGRLSGGEDPDGTFPPGGNHICAVSNDEGVTWGAPSKVSISGPDNVYEALTMLQSGVIGEVQSSVHAGGLEYSALSLYGVDEPNGWNPGLELTLDHRKLTDPMLQNADATWDAGTAPAFTVGNTTQYATQSCIGFRFLSTSPQYTRFCANRIGNTARTFWSWDVADSFISSQRPLTLDVYGLHLSAAIYGNGGKLWTPSTADDYFGLSTGSPVLASGTPGAGKYIDGLNGTWTTLPAPGTGTVTTSGSPVSPNIAAFSSGTEITAATSANIQTAIGSGVYATAAQGLLAASAIQPSAATPFAPLASVLTQTGGAATLTGFYTITNGVTFATIRIVPVTSTTSSVSSGTSITLPTHPLYEQACPITDAAVDQLGNALAETDAHVYVPTWVAVTAAITITCSYY